MTKQAKLRKNTEILQFLVEILGAKFLTLNSAVWLVEKIFAPNSELKSRRAELAEWLAHPSDTRETWVIFPRSAALIMVFVIFHGSSRQMLGQYRWQVDHDRISFPPHYLLSLSLFFPCFPHGLQALHYAACSWAFNVALVALPVKIHYLPISAR